MYGDWTQGLCTELLLQPFFILKQGLTKSLNCPGWAPIYHPLVSVSQNAEIHRCVAPCLEKTFFLKALDVSLSTSLYRWQMQSSEHVQMPVGTQLVRTKGEPGPARFQRGSVGPGVRSGVTAQLSNRLGQSIPAQSPWKNTSAPSLPAAVLIPGREGGGVPAPRFLLPESGAHVTVQGNGHLGGLVLAGTSQALTQVCAQHVEAAAVNHAASLLM